MAFNADINTQLLSKYGFSGQAGGGAGDSYLKKLYTDKNYGALQGYQKDRQAYNPEYNYDYLGFQMPDASKMTGAMPATVEPFNSVQKTALTNQANGAPESDFYKQMMPLFQQSLQQLTQAANSTGFNPQQANLQNYINPEVDNIMGGVQNDLRKQANIAQNQVASRAARFGNSGSSAQAMQNAAVENQLNDTLAKTSTQVRSGAYDNAMGNARDDFYKNLTNRYQAANGLGTMAGAAQGFDAYGRNAYNQQNQIALGAGDRIQAQNQTSLNAMNGLAGQDINYQMQMLNFLRGILGSYPTGTTQTSTSGGNAMQGLIGGGMVGSQLNLGNPMADSSLPWSTWYGL